MPPVCPWAYPGRRVRRLGMRTFLLILLHLVGLPAFAQAFGSPQPATWTSVQPAAAAQVAARGVNVRPAQALQPGPLYDLLKANRVVTVGTLPGSVLLSDLLKAPSPAGVGTVDVTVKRGIPWASVSRGVARSLPLIGTALTIKELLDAVRCREGMGGAGECDPGVAQVPVQSFCSSASGTKYCGTREAVASQTVARLNVVSSNGGQYTYTVGAIEPNFGSYGRFNVWQKNNFNAGAPLSLWGSPAYSSESALQCEPIPDGNGGTRPAVLGPDGKCESGSFEPASEEQIGSKVEQWGDKSKAVSAAGQMSAAGIPMDHPSPQFEGPAAVAGGRQTTQHPDGSTTTRDVDHPITYTPDGYKWEDRLTERTWPPGTTPDAPGAPPGAGTPPATTTTGAPTPAPVEVLTCGLPGKPPCKIDETGTPGPPAPPDDPFVTGADLRAFIDNPQVADTGWSWTLTLPVSCSVLTVGPFFTQMVEVDLCAYQPMIHDLVGLLWIGATFWFALGIVGRTFLT